MGGNFHRNMQLCVSLFGDDGISEKSNLKQNIRALQFGITDFFRFTNFTGSTLSLKKHSTANKAIRLGLSITKSFYNEVGSENYEEFRYDSLFREYQKNIKDLNETEYFGITIEKIKYTKSITNLYPYYGIGLSFYYSGLTTEEDEPYYQTNTINNYNIDSYSAGLLGVVGIEWFFKESISFHSEYHSTFRIGKRSEETEIIEYASSSNPERTITKTKEPFHDVGSYVKFGVSFYF